MGMIIVPTLVVPFAPVIFGRGCGRLRPAFSPAPPEMSSTLFNRGTTTQTGIRRRAEAVEKSIADLRTAVSTSDETARLVRILEARILALERKVTELEIAKETATTTTPVADAETATATTD
jgi:hypothetical protein